MNHWQIGPYFFSGDGVLRLGSQLVPLSPLQRKLLFCFVRHSGQLIERAQLFQEVWGHAKVSDVSLARAVHSLRQVFDRGPLGSGAISTTYGSGYVFTAPVLPIPPEQVVGSDAEITTPSPLALELYFEARVASRHFDPLSLERSQGLLKRALQQSPTFCEAILFLVSVQLNRCRWGLLESQAVAPELEALLRRAEQLQTTPENLFALQAETTSLLYWQPTLVEESFGGWLSDRLGYGLPLLSWVRHLFACGRAREGLTLLEPHLDGALPMGWTLAAQLTFHLGQPKAAIEMLRGQLRQNGSLPPSHLFVALLQAHLGDRIAALSSLNHCNLQAMPFLGFQAAVAYVLAKTGEMSRAEALLHQARTGKDGLPGMASLWGLAAMVLGHQDMAAHFFRSALAKRCYQAPFLAQSPLLAPYAQEPVVVDFLESMAGHFPSLARACAPLPEGSLGSRGRVGLKVVPAAAGRAQGRAQA